MDVLISLGIGILVLVLVGALALATLGVRAEWIDPITGFGGIRLSRRINAARRRRSIKRLPPGIPPPPGP